MRKLHVVGLTPDNDGLIFSTRKGSKSGSYVAALSGELLDWVAEAERVRNEEYDPAPAPPALSSREPRRPRPESALTPREIQARLRAGRTINEVAKEAGVHPDWVERFAAPILAEQASIVDMARGLTFSKARLGESTEPLGPSVAANLVDRGVRFLAEEFDAGWSAFQLHDGVWMVRFQYLSRGRTHEAAWQLDATTGRLHSADRLASNLGYVEPGRRRRSRMADGEDEVDEIVPEDEAPPRRPVRKRPVPARATPARATKAAKAAVKARKGTKGTKAVPAAGAAKSTKTAKAAKAGKATKSARVATAAKRTTGRTAGRATRPAAAAAAAAAKAPAKTTRVAKTRPGRAAVSTAAKAPTRPRRPGQARIEAPKIGTDGSKLSTVVQWPSVSKRAQVQPAPAPASSRVPPRAPSAARPPASAGPRPAPSPSPAIRRQAPPSQPAQPARRPTSPSSRPSPATPPAQPSRAGSAQLPRRQPPPARPSERGPERGPAPAPSPAPAPAPRQASPPPRPPSRPAPPPTRVENGAGAQGSRPGPTQPLAPRPPDVEAETQPQRSGGRFGRIAERLASAGRADSDRRSRGRDAGADLDEDDDERTDEPRRGPARWVAPPHESAHNDEDRSSSSAEDAFVIRPRISARQASELAFSEEQPRWFGPLLRDGIGVPPVSPAGS